MNKELFNHNNRTTPSLKELGETFRLRAYGRTELAQAYNPHLSPGAAWQKLSMWIHLYPELTERLKAIGYSPHQRVFTPRQVAMIVEALGEP